MKILFVVNGFPPKRWAGTETYTAAIAGELMKRGHSVQVLCCGEWHDGPKHWNGYVDEIYKGIPIRRINLNWQKSSDPYKHLYNNPLVADFLNGYLKELGPDLVHVTSCETLSASVLEEVNRHRIPLVLSITDFWFLCPTINLLRSDGHNCSGITTPWDCLKCTSNHSKPYRWTNQILPEKMAKEVLTRLSKKPILTRQRTIRGMVGDMEDRKKYTRRVFSLPDIRLVASEFIRDVHIQNGFDDPIEIHPYGHDLSWLSDYQGKLDSKTFRIGFIGRITYSKGVHLLLEAARRIKGVTSQRVKFLIYGNTKQHPEYASPLMKQAKELGSVEFCGVYPREKSADVFSTIDILVVPSLWYDFPLIIHEAFATGTPVIATNLGSMAEIVTHEKNGLLFERGNVEDLVHQIQRLTTEPGLLQRLKKGISKVKSVQEEINELEKTYLRLFSLALMALRLFWDTGA